MKYLNIFGDIVMILGLFKPLLVLQFYLHFTIKLTSAATYYKDGISTVPEEHILARYVVASKFQCNHRCKLQDDCKEAVMDAKDGMCYLMKEKNGSKDVNEDGETTDADLTRMVPYPSPSKIIMWCQFK